MQWRLSLGFTLHIDDTLICGNHADLSWVAETLETYFSGLTTDRNHFRHCGIDTYRSPTLYHIYCSQEDYVNELAPIDLKGTRLTDEASATLITSFRSLVAGAAWVGMTWGPALAAGSLYQAFLPKPLVSHLRMLSVSRAAQEGIHTTDIPSWRP